MTETMIRFQEQIKQLKYRLTEMEKDLVEKDTTITNYEEQLRDNEKSIAYLQGQVRAFEFCIKRRADNENS